MGGHHNLIDNAPFLRSFHYTAAAYFNSYH